MCLRVLRDALVSQCTYRFTTYQDARRVRLVDGLETNILRVSPVYFRRAVDMMMMEKISRNCEISVLEISSSKTENGEIRDWYCDFAILFGILTPN